MLITLSSSGEKDPALFQNTFSETFVVEPNSYVCLISASILEDWTNGSINVAAGTTMSVRFDPYNNHQQILNAADTKYTTTEFIDHLNTLFGGLLYLGRRFKAILETDPNTPNQAEIKFNLYKTDLDDTINYLNYIFPVNTGNPSFRQQQNTNFITIPTVGNLPPGQPLQYAIYITSQYNIGAIVPDLTAPAGSNHIALFTGGPTYAIGGPLEANTTLNIPSRESFQHQQGFKMENPDWTSPKDAPWSMFCINNVPTRDKLNNANISYEFKISPCVFNNGTGEYTSIPLNGNGLTMEFNDVGKLIVTINNVETGIDDIVSNNNYNLGNQYKVGISIAEDAAGGGDGIPAVVEFDYNGLVFWLPGSCNYTGGGGEPGGTTNMTWNSRYVYNYPGINFLYENQNLSVSEILTPSRFKSTPTTRSADNSQMGCWASIGFQDATAWSGINEQSIYKDNGLNEVITTGSYPTAPWADFVSNVALYNRVDTTTPEPPSPNSSKMNHLSLLPVLDTINPICITCLFYLQNDTAVVTSGTGQYQMCLMGGVRADLTTREKIIELHIDQLTSLSPSDITITDRAGNTATSQLINIATGNRINISYGNWYMFSYQDDGQDSTGPSAVKIKITELASNVIYEATPIIIAGLPFIDTLGGIGDTIYTGAENWFHGHIADFRFYTKPFEFGVVAVNDWDPLVLALTGSYVNGRGFYTNEICAKPVQNNLYVAAESKYATFEQPNSNLPVTPFFIMKDVVNTNLPISGYAFSDIFLPPQIKIPFIHRTLDLPERALTGIGNGLVEVADINSQFTLENYDEINERDILPFVWKDNLTPYFSATGEVANIELDDEIFNIEIKNLPHRSMNGVNKSFDKTIYQIPIEQGVIKNNLTIHEHSPANKVWIPLKNPGELPLNQIEVQISQSDGKKATGLNHETHLVLQIEKREDIL